MVFELIQGPNTTAVMLLCEGDLSPAVIYALALWLVSMLESSAAHALIYSTRCVD